MPVSSRVEPPTDNALRELERRGYAVRRGWGHSAIDSGRNAMANHALRDGFEEIMWIDADVVFDPDDVEKLRTHERPITCGVYAKKGPREMACNFPPGMREVKFGGIGGIGGLTRVAEVGMGFVHTRRAVYEKIVETCRLPLCNEVWNDPQYPYFWPPIKQEWKGEKLYHHYRAEDYAFCDRAAEAGFEIWADLSIRLFHIGSYWYGWEEAGREVERYGNYTYHIGGDSQDAGDESGGEAPKSA